jgi:LPS-assembly lipoprotein
MRNGEMRLRNPGLLIALSILLSSCGFHLRGEATFPFHALYISGAGGTPYYYELTRVLRSNKTTTLVDTPDKADAILDLSKATGVDKQILALSGGGKVREFLLVQVIGFRVHDGKGGEWLPYGEIRIRRDFSYTDSQALAKESEERLLVADMQSDAVQQTIRRLQAAHKPTPQ